MRTGRNKCDQAMRKGWKETRLVELLWRQSQFPTNFGEERMNRMVNSAQPDQLDDCSECKGSQ